MKVLNILGIIFTAMCITTISKIIWLMPVQIYSESFYNEWFTFHGGHLSFWVMFTWFMLGSLKIAVTYLQNNSQDFPGTKACIIAPIAPFINIEKALKISKKA